MIISRDKKLLYPPFALLLVQFEEKLLEKGLPFYLFMALRDFATQDELYAQGRTTPGDIVTNAKGGDSWHNYGLAADYVLDGMPEKPGIQWSWKTRNVDFNEDGTNDWQQMGQIAETCGLQWGGRWKKFPDLPHVQNKYGLSLNEAKELHRVGGVKKVWEACDAA